MPKYRQPFSVDYRTPVYISSSDPRATKDELKKNMARHGREIVVIENKQSITLDKYSEPAAYWISLYNSKSRGSAITTDPSGNVYVVGFDITNPTYFITLFKYNKKGTMIWQRKIYGTYSSYGLSIKLSANGNIIIAGLVENGTNADSFLISVNNSGVVLWQRKIATATYSSSTTYSSHYGNFDIDSDNNIYLSVLKQGTSDNSDYVVLLKYDLDGILQWQKKYKYVPTTYSIDLNMFEGKVCIDSNDNKYLVFATPYDNALTIGKTMQIIKYDSTDTQVWQKTLFYADDYNSNYGKIMPVMAKTDSDGNLYICAVLTGQGIFQTASLIKYNSSGVVQWKKNYSQKYNETPEDNFSYSVDFDFAGNVYWLSNNQLAYAFITNFDTDGNVLFKRQIYFSWDGSNGTARVSGIGLKINSKDDIAITGTVIPTNSSYNQKTFTIKLPSDGSLTGTYYVPIPTESSVTNVICNYETSTKSLATLTFTTPTFTQSATTGDLTESELTLSNATTTVTISTKAIS